MTPIRLALASGKEDTVQFQDTEIFGNIDPHFQRLLERRQRGLSSPFTSSTDTDEVAVIGRVSDVEAWEALSEVRVGVTVGQLEDGSWIVTGRIPVRRIEAVRQAEPVYSLKPARRLRPFLAATLRETGARLDLLPDQAQGQQGDGVVVGIVDFGCDFQHHNFRRADGTSRILAIWDQTGPSRPDSPFGYGRLYTQQDINRALQEDDPYDELGYGPSPDSELSSPGTHGTHVMDIAAGNGLGSGTPGVAPNADIIFVEPATSDIPWSGPEAVGSNFGDSVQLLEAIRFIFDQAGDRPCVVNISLGTNGGAHDGRSLVELGIDTMVAEQANRAVVIAASNSFDDNIHASGDVTQGDHTDLLWNIPFFDFTNNELEIWYAADDEFRLELIAPNGQSLGSVSLGQNGRLRDDDGQTLLFISHRRSDPNNEDHTIGIFMENQLPAGTWTVRLHGVTINDGRFHAWIERDDAGQSSFGGAHEDTHTLGSISTGQLSVVVGSYDAHKASLPLSWFSSAGPTRDGREKPEISAPGHAVWAAHSRTEDGVIRKSGTSMAAPAVTGIIALMLAEARARNVNLTINELRDILTQSSRKNPPANAGWHNRYGHGRIDAVAAIERVIAMA